MMQIKAIESLLENINHKTVNLSKAQIELKMAYNAFGYGSDKEG